MVLKLTDKVKKLFVHKSDWILTHSCRRERVENFLADSCRKSSRKLNKYNRSGQKQTFFDPLRFANLARSNFLLKKWKPQFFKLIKMYKDDCNLHGCVIIENFIEDNQFKKRSNFVLSVLDTVDSPVDFWAVLKNELRFLRSISRPKSQNWPGSRPKWPYK